VSEKLSLARDSKRLLGIERSLYFYKQLNINELSSIFCMLAWWLLFLDVCRGEFRYSGYPPHEPNHSKSMKLKTLTKVGAVLTAVFALSSAANAAFINGKIDFGITATLDNTDLGLATQVTTWDLVFASLVSDDFDTFVNPLDVPTTFTDPWSFNSGPVTPLWAIGGFTFDLTSSSIVTQSNTFLNVVGSGLVSGNSFTPTPGTWSFTITNQGGGVQNQFSFVASTSSVPDGGATVALLGVSLLGLHGARRKFGKR
jgi:hypothetical protein